MTEINEPSRHEVAPARHDDPWVDVIHGYIAERPISKPAVPPPAGGAQLARPAKPTAMRR